ncbi:hypothetical protein KIF53_09340 [Chromobacterium subtsugae]|uniref:Uncharacterized protein n=1 Tax=Chromobacterium subtsugae TaxID=251747 RepID=A0ABS7FCL8_9NEIS|nr:MULTISPECIES: hypothetical protein [Chromobacterium]MBW7566315.1 hypothetical protein [Chromobacterium subtsugae]MBW8287826.1 hypothetical protein [Chromobacterium subtsugae]WSE91155.1 hypothetical protein U6115_20125 [Chromobacterium subtsugae]WVH59530.1 hypothetical protein U6151_20155 [Chromobacterium subtsugae]
MDTTKKSIDKKEKSTEAETKRWAYINPTGKDWVSAETIKRRRDNENDGNPLGDIYYSSGWPRKRMSHKISANGVPFFSYINAADREGGGGGESLAHRLFKDALLQINETTLKIKNLGDFRVSFHGGDTEVVVGNNEYKIDAFRNFQSETFLEKKWSGRIYIEVHNTHLVEKEKRDRLIKERLPTIEISINDIYRFNIPEEQATDKDIAEYFQRVKRIAESQNGFLSATIISNPSSIEYLEELNEKLQTTIKDRDSALHKLTEEISDKNRKIALQISKEKELKEQLEDQINASKKIEKENASSTKMLTQRNDSYEGDILTLKKQNEDLKKQKEMLTIAICITSILLMIAFYFIKK